MQMFDSTKGVEAVPCTAGLTFGNFSSMTCKPRKVRFAICEPPSNQPSLGLIMSSLEYGQISKILRKRKEASQKREEFSQKIEAMGGVNSDGPERMIWLPGKGRPQKRSSDAADYFRHPTSHYKYQQHPSERCRTKRFRLR